MRRYADARATAGVLGYNDPVYKGTRVEGEWNMELSGISRQFSPADLHRILTNEKPRGNDLVLTLDLRLQQEACAALGTRRGAVVMLDPSTGGILALATYPTFNPETLRDDFPTLNAADGRSAAQSRGAGRVSARLDHETGHRLRGVDEWDRPRHSLYLHRQNARLWRDHHRFSRRKAWLDRYDHRAGEIVQ